MAPGEIPPQTLAQSLAVDWSDLDTKVLGDRSGSSRGGQAIVFLHGYTGNNIVGANFARRLLAPGVRIFVPSAPLRIKDEQRAWWLFHADDRPRPYTGEHDLEEARPPSRQLLNARAAILALVARIRRDHDPASVALVGFSQGAMLALDVGLAEDAEVERIAALGGTLQIDSVASAIRPRVQRPSIFLSSGRGDPRIPFEAVEQAKNFLEQNDFHVTWKPHAGGHIIRQPVVDDLRRFLGV